MFPDQFVNYLGDILTLNFGLSYKFRQPVTEVISSRFWRTLLLVGVSTILFTLIGIWIGMWSAWRRGSSLDYGGLGFSLVTYSMPEFWLGMLLLLAFAVLIPIFPVGGVTTTSETYTGLRAAWDVAGHMVLPTITLVLAYIGEYALIMRSSLLDVMTEDYLQTARAKGLRDVFVRRRHAVPNALLPTVTLIALNLGFIVSGAITVGAGVLLDRPRVPHGRGPRRPGLPIAPGTVPVLQRRHHPGEPRRPTSSTGTWTHG